MKRCLIVFILIALPALNGCSSARAKPQVATATQPVFIQSKACEHISLTSWDWIGPCMPDKPLTPGNMAIVVGGMGCNASGCDSVSDSQGNAWHVALVVPNWNGIPLWYALNVKGGPDTIYFASGTMQVAIFAEYTPTQGLDSLIENGVKFDAVNYGTYSQQNLHGIRQGDSSDTGWTLPVETTESCELLISWGTSGAGDLSSLHGTLKPSAGPSFTVRDYEYGAIGLEDAITTTPGLYIGTMSWNGYAHWDMGVAAFKMGGCK
jgi:hypothetical protein